MPRRISLRNAEIQPEVQAAHRKVKAYTRLERMALTGQHHGKVLCELCGKPASDAHHLIVPRNQVQKSSLSVQLYIEHKYNIVWLCNHCHVGRKDSAEAHRDYLINVQYRRYGLRPIVQWVERLRAKSNLVITLPQLELQ